MEQDCECHNDDEVKKEDKRRHIDVRVLAPEHARRDVRAAGRCAGRIAETIARTGNESAIDRREHRLFRDGIGEMREKVDEQRACQHAEKRKADKTLAKLLPRPDEERGIDRDRNNTDRQAGKQVHDLRNAGHTAGNNAVREREIAERDRNQGRSHKDLQNIKPEFSVKFCFHSSIGFFLYYFVLSSAPSSSVICRSPRSSSRRSAPAAGMLRMR